jgi:hypothetical protein
MKAPDLFVISALVLLGFAFVARFISPTGLGVSVAWRGTGYVMPPEAIAIAMATALCFCATVYSLWMLPFSRPAALWHFWLTIFGIAVFWLSFYRMSSGSRAAVWASFLTPLAVILTQLTFVWNVVRAIIKMPQLHN